MTVQQGHHFSMSGSEQGSDFLKVLWTGRHAQLALMTIPPGEEIGEEIHDHEDQVIAVLEGQADVTLHDDGTFTVGAGEVVVVPAGQRHNVVSTGSQPLRLYTVYGPPTHAVDAVYATRADAQAAEDSGEDDPPPQGI